MTERNDRNNEAGSACGCGPGDLTRKEVVMANERVSTTVPLNWKEVWFTNCPMVSALSLIHI